MSELPKDLKDRYIRSFTEQKGQFDRLAERSARLRNRSIRLGVLSVGAAGIEYFAKVPIEAVIGTGAIAVGFAYTGYRTEMERKKAVSKAKHRQRNIYELHEGLEPTLEDRFTGAE
jgi:hypothetical protein